MVYRVSLYPCAKLISNDDIVRQLNTYKGSETETNSISVCLDSNNSSLSDDIKMLLLHHENLILVSCNFNYKTMFQEKHKYSDSVIDNLFSNNLQSFISNMLSPTNSDTSSLQSDSETENDKIYLVLGFLIYNTEILKKENPLESIKNDVKDIRILYLHIRVVIILQGIRDIITHFGKYNSDLPITSRDVDDLICSLLISQQVDTLETIDSSETFEFIFKTCNTITNAPNYHEFDMFRNKNNAKCNCNDMDIYEKIWINQLMQIPGIGENVAKVIAQLYKTPVELISALSSTGDIGKQLENIHISSSKGFRKLGPVLANRLIHMFGSVGSENDVVVKQPKRSVKSEI